MKLSVRSRDGTRGFRRPLFHHHALCADTVETDSFLEVEGQAMRALGFSEFKALGLL